MKLLRQIYRRPVKPLLLALLIAMAVMILITSVGQYVSTALTRLHLDDSYSTVALRSPWGRKTGSTVSPTWSQEIQELKDDLLTNHPDMVLGESYSGLYSMYIPELKFDNFSDHELGNTVGDEIAGQNNGYPYRDAMLVVRLEKIGTVEDADIEGVWDSTGVMSTFEISSSVMCSGVIEQVVGLADSYDPPVGKTITLTIYTANGNEKTELEVGKSYIVFGRDYLNMNGPSQDWLRRTEQGIELYGTVKASYKGDSVGYFEELDRVGVMLTVRDKSAEPVKYRNDNGFELRWDLRKNSVLIDGKVMMSYTDAAEFVKNYRVPTIAPLNRTVEEFLNSPEGSLWKIALEEMEINNHSFPVMGVENLNYQSTFSQGEAYIIQGRAFTQEEIQNGKRVCVISDALAEINGLSVGDSICMQAVMHDANLWDLTSNDLRSDVAYPSAAHYSRARGFETEPENFTIVGIYHYNEAWQTNYHFDTVMNEYYREGSVSVFGYTTNTIFVPHTSVNATPILHEDGMFHALIIKNGMMEEFKAYLEEQGHKDVFICRDGGYSQIVADLNSYEGVSQSILFVGLVGGLVLLVLFVTLLSLQSKNNVYLLRAMGATRKQRIIYLCTNGFVPLIIGTAIGFVAGSFAWDKAAVRLMASFDVNIPLVINSGRLAFAISGAQLLLTMIMILFMSIVCSGGSNFMKRR